MKSIITNILFDLDGTLTNPKEGIINSYLYSLKRLHLREDNPDSIASFIGLPLHTYFEVVHKLSGVLIDRAVELYREYYSVKGQFENILFDGITDMLDLLIHNNNTLYLVTSKPTLFAETILNFFKIKTYFKSIYGSDLSSYNKSKSELIKLAIVNENIRAENCIMVGDRMHDIIGAKDNNVASIAVTYGFGSIEELSKYTPLMTADSVTDLISIFSDS